MTDRPSLFMRPLPAALFILIAIVLDQIIKFVVEAELPFQEAVPVVPYLALYRTWNEGVAFSFLSGMSSWGIVGMRLVIVGLILWWWRNSARASSLMHIGFAMIISGAIGNIIDHFVYGHVVDYVLFHTESWSFAVFNLADSLITMGAVAVGFSELLLPRNETKSGD